MKAKGIKFFGFLFLSVFLGQFLPTQLFAKPSYHLYKTRSQPSNAWNANKGDFQNASSYDDLFHEIENHELEMKMIDERLNTQENILDALRQQFLDANLANQEMFKGNTALLEKRVLAIESAISAVTKDLQDLQRHANESAKVLSQYKLTITDLGKKLEGTQSVLHSLLTAVEAEEGSPKENLHLYEVKSGDILDKIAKKHSTTVKKIKELNGLTNDRIYAGQKLKIPSNN